MNKSLEDFKRNSPHSSKPFYEIENRLNQVKRFSKNTLWSFGISPSENEKIWGRIYLSYCFGYLMGAAKYWNTEFYTTKGAKSQKSENGANG